MRTRRWQERNGARTGCINEVKREAMQQFYMNCELVINETSQTICKHGQCPEHLLVLAFDVISEPFRFPLVIGNNACPSEIVRPCGRTLRHHSIVITLDWFHWINLFGPKMTNLVALVKTIYVGFMSRTARQICILIHIHTHPINNLCTVLLNWLILLRIYWLMLLANLCHWNHLLSSDLVLIASAELIQ